jgi:preprotein translocase subunit YajC
MLYALTTLLADVEEKAASENQPLWSLLLPPFVIIALFFFLIILPAQRREKKQREALNSALKKNDEVVTSAGIIGVVQNIKPDEDEVTLKVDDNVRIRVLKSSIVRIKSKDSST